MLLINLLNALFRLKSEIAPDCVSAIIFRVEKSGLK